MIKALLKEFSYTVFPRKCTNCGVFEESYICSSCAKYLQIIEPECFVTRTPSREWNIREKRKVPFEKVYYFYKYNRLIHNLIISIKYSFHYDKVEKVIDLIMSAEEFNKISFSEIDLITYVPIAKQREAWRGFNQSKLMAQKLSQSLHIPYITLLEKVKSTKPQIELKREDRLANVRSSFRIKGKVDLNFSSQSILLVDDICTTGTTLIECARQIKNRYPGVKIYGLCLARGEK